MTGALDMRPLLPLSNGFETPWQALALGLPPAQIVSVTSGRFAAGSLDAKRIQLQDVAGQDV